MFVYMFICLHIFQEVSSHSPIDVRIMEEEIREAGLILNVVRCEDEQASRQSIHSVDYFETETVTLQIGIGRNGKLHGLTVYRVQPQWSGSIVREMLER